MYELKAEHISMLMVKVSKEGTGEFTIEKALRIYPINDQVFKYNQAILDHFRSKEIPMIKIAAQDQFLDATSKIYNINFDDIIPTYINKTGDLHKQL